MPQTIIYFIVLDLEEEFMDGKDLSPPFLPQVASCLIQTGSSAMAWDVKHLLFSPVILVVNRREVGETVSQFPLAVAAPHSAEHFA